MLSESSYTKYLEQVNSLRQKAEWWLQGLGEEEQGITVQWGEISVWEEENVPDMEGGDDHTTV